MAAFLGKLPGARQADALGRTRDEGELAAQIALVTSGELRGAELERALGAILRLDPANPQANLRLALRTTDKGDTEILRVDPEGFKKVYECSVFESAAPVAFHKDGKHVYLETNKGARDLSELVLFDPATGKEEKLESDPKGRVDFGSALFSDLTDELIATFYQDDRTRIYWKDKAWEADFKLLQKKLPGREVALASMTHDEQLIMVASYSDRDPGSRGSNQHPKGKRPTCRL